MRLDLAGHEVACDDALGVAIDDDQFEHFGARKDFDGAETDLPHHRRIRAEQKLLAGLAARVKCPRNLRAAE